MTTKKMRNFITKNYFKLPLTKLWFCIWNEVKAWKKLQNCNLSTGPKQLYLIVWFSLLFAYLSNLYLLCKFKGDKSD